MRIYFVNSRTSNRNRMFASNISDTEEYSTLFKPKLSIKLTNKPKSPVLMIKREKVTF